MRKTSGAMSINLLCARIERAPEVLAIGVIKATTIVAESISEKTRVRVRDEARGTPTSSKVRDEPGIRGELGCRFS